MNIPNAKSAQAAATLNRSMLKEKFKQQLEKKIEEEIIKEIGVGGYSITLNNSDIDFFRPDYGTEATKEIVDELREKGYKVLSVYCIMGDAELSISWRKEE